MTTDYTHTALARDRDEIRLLSIHEASKEHVSVRVDTFNLSACPPFAAVSYTWGPATPIRDIQVNDRQFAARQNLWDVLHMLRDYITAKDSRQTSGTAHVRFGAAAEDRLQAKNTQDISEADEPTVGSSYVGLNAVTDDWADDWADHDAENEVENEGENEGEIVCKDEVDDDEASDESDDEANKPYDRRPNLSKPTPFYNFVWPWYDHQDISRAEQRHEGLRSSWAKRGNHLWIDAICIDQTNSEERSHQVGLMGKIFSRATFVLSMLSTAADGSDELMSQILRDGKTHMSNAGDSYHMGDLSALADLANRSYWRRLWVVQEVVLAQDVIVVCGTKFVSWSALTRWIMSVHDQNPYNFQHFVTEHLIFLVRQRQSLQESMTNNQPIRLDTLIEQFENKKCSDVRDHIYALLSLARGEIPNHSTIGKGPSLQSSTDLIADYTIDPGVLFDRVVQAVQHSPRLGINGEMDRFKRRLQKILQL